MRESSENINGNPLAVKERSRLPRSQWCQQNMPIESDLKIKRVYEKEPVSAACWAYMRLLRTQSKTKRVYPVDPYVEVYQFRENLYGLLTESADGAGDVWMYLIIGPEKAMLIDTGFGIGNLKALVETLAPGKEILVVNTHGHFDHAYGNCQFARVYCHAYEVPSLKKQDAHIWDYLFDEVTGQGIWSEFDRADLVTFRPYEIVGCPDHYMFDLGSGYQIELLHMGGHTPGHAGFLDRQNRILFAGDDIVSMRIGVGGPRPETAYGQYATVNTLCRRLGEIAARQKEFDFVFPSHFITELENVSVTAVYDACRAVLKAPFQACHYTKGSGDGTRYFRYVDGLGTLCYSSRSVLSENTPESH